jgi:hypothetical protein
MVNEFSKKSSSWRETQNKVYTEMKDFIEKSSLNLKNTDECHKKII